MIINPNDDEQPHLEHFHSAKTPGKGELMGFKVVTKRWSQIKAIFAETGHSHNLLLKALRIGHGIHIDDVTFEVRKWYRMKPKQCWYELSHEHDEQVGKVLGDQFIPDQQVADLMNEGAKQGRPDDMQSNPFLFFVVSEEQKNLLAAHEIPSPTWMQLLGTCEVIDTNEENAVRRFRELKGDPRA